MTATDTWKESAEGEAVEATLVDPESGEEIVFRAANEDELERAIEAHFDPFHEDNAGDGVA